MLLYSTVPEVTFSVLVTYFGTDPTYENVGVNTTSKKKITELPLQHIVGPASKYLLSTSAFELNEK
jgi:hypothetical protein